MQGKMMRPVEDLAIRPLVMKRARGEAYGIEEWMEFLKPIMGDEIQERYKDMLAGKIILLDPRLFGAASSLSLTGI